MVLTTESRLLAMRRISKQPLEALKVLDAGGFKLAILKGFTWHKPTRNRETKWLWGRGI